MLRLMLNPRGIWRCPLSALLPLSHKQEIQRSYAFHLRGRLIPVSASRCSRLFKTLLTFLPPSPPPPRLHIPRLALNKTPTHISLAASLFTRAETRLQTRRGALHARSAQPSVTLLHPRRCVKKYKHRPGPLFVCGSQTAVRGADADPVLFFFF